MLEVRVEERALSLCLGRGLWGMESQERLAKVCGSCPAKEAGSMGTTRRPHARHSLPADEPGNMPMLVLQVPPTSGPDSQCSGLSPLRVSSCAPTPCLTYQVQLLTFHLLHSLGQAPGQGSGRPAPPGQQLQERRPEECWRVQAGAVRTP